jgi:hypothetical protein
MGHRIGFTAAEWSELSSHLLRSDVEEAAIVFAEARLDDGEFTFRPKTTWCLSDEDFEFRSSFHLSLTDAAQQRIIQTAWNSGTAIVEFHSHVSGRFPAEFSTSDLAGFEEFVPHAMWRLPSRPYGAVVVSPTGFDSLIWTAHRGEPQSLEHIAVDDSRRIPTGMTIRSLGVRHG